MTVATTLERRLMAPRPDRPPDRGGCCHIAVVTVRGDLDATGLEHFGRVLDDALSSCYHVVVVDLSEAEFVSIQAAALLTEAKRRALRSRLDMALVSGSPAVEHLLRVTGLHPLFRDHSSLKSARHTPLQVSRTFDIGGAKAADALYPRFTPVRPMGAFARANTWMALCGLTALIASLPSRLSDYRTMGCHDEVRE